MFNRTKNLKLSVIKQMELRASRYPDVVSLAQGIPGFDTPGCIKRRVERALNKGVVAKYSLSPGLPELREIIEISLAKNNMFYDWQKEIIVTAGAIEGITATLLTITSAGDEIIIPNPTYTSYREIINLAGCKPVYVTLDPKNGWAFDLQKFEKAITKKTKAIFYCNPNNPTGTIYTKKQLLSLAKLAEKHNLYLISDEVYKDFIFDPEESGKFFSLAEIPEYRKRLIRVFSFSKPYAMTGWRVGYLHTDESIAQEILKVHDSLVTCAPVISQYAAMGALEMGDKDLKRFVKEFKDNRDLVCSRLDKMKNVFEYVKPNSAYYVFPKIIPPSQPPSRSSRHRREELYGKPSPKTNTFPISHEERMGEGPGVGVDSWKFALELLDKAHVAVVPGIAFGPSGERHIRINFGRSKNDINKAFDRMEEYFSKL